MEYSTTSAIAHHIIISKLTDEQTRYLSLVLNNIQEAVIASDNEYNLLAWNARAEAMYGWKAEEVLGKNGLGIIQTQFPEADKENMLRMIAEQGQYHGEATQVRKDGSRFPVEVNSLVLRNTEGQIAGYLSINRDISEDKKARKALQESEDRFKSLFDNAVDAMFITSPDEGAFLAANDAACRMFGYTEQEFIEGGRDMVLDALDPRLPGILQERFLHGRVHGELAYIRRDGTKFEGEASSALYQDKNGALRASLIIRDISERKQAEMASQESEKMNTLLVERLHEAQRLAHIGSWEWDLLTDRIWWSEETYRIFGVTPGEYIPNFEANARFIHPEDRESYMRAFAGLLKSGTPLEIDVRLVAGDGSLKDCHARGQLVRDDSGRPIRFVGTVMDITERKQADKRLVYQAFLLSNVSDAVVATDENLSINFWNKAAEDLYGWKADEVLGHSSSVVLQSEFVGLTRAEAMQTLRKNGELHCEALQYRKDGSRLFIEGKTIALQDEYGNRSGYIAANRDISERKKMEDAVAEIAKFPAEDPNPVLRVSHEGVLMYANRASQYLLNDWKCAVGEQVPLFWRTQVVEVIAQEQNRLVEFACGDITYLVVIVHLKDNAYANLYMTNISIRKHAEEKLRKAEEQYRFLLDNTSDFIAHFDQSGIMVFGTDASLQFHGYDPVEIINTSAFERIHPDDSGQVRDELQHIIQTGAEGRSVYRLKRKDGEYIWVESIGRRVFNADGEAEVVVVQRDVTKRKQAEEELQKNHERLLKFASQVPGMLYQFEMRPDGSFRVPFSTDKIRDVFGCSPEEVRETFAPVARVIHPDDIAAINIAIEESARNLTPFYMEYRVTLPGQPMRWIEAHSLPEKLPDGSIVWSGFNADVTQRKHTQEELLELNRTLEERVHKRTTELVGANQKMEHALRVKDEFMANMSHELRTPLNAIIGISDSLLEQTAGVLNDRQQRYIDMIGQSGHHLLSLINDILDLSKIEAEKLEVFIEPVLVAEVCKDSLALVNEAAIKKGLTMIFLPDMAVEYINADKRRLKQILVNLLSNAVKFTPPQGTITLTINANRIAKNVEFAVSDTGIGITRKDIQRLFTPFTQVDSSLTRQAEGTGLGLVLVKRLAEQHGGSVSVHSEVGNGSTFTVSIPWNEMVDGQSRSVTAVESAVRQLNAAETSTVQDIILLAEDNKVSVMVTGDYLTAKGYKVVCADNGLDAIEKAHESLPDLILMDIQMPVMDGLTVIRSLRAETHFADTPIIALTALAMPDDLKRCLEAGATEYISKPFSLKYIHQLIIKLLEEKRAGIS